MSHTAAERQRKAASSITRLSRRSHLKMTTCQDEANGEDRSQQAETLGEDGPRTNCQLLPMHVGISTVTQRKTMHPELRLSIIPSAFIML